MPVIMNGFYKFIYLILTPSLILMHRINRCRYIKKAIVKDRGRQAAFTSLGLIVADLDARDR